MVEVIPRPTEKPSVWQDVILYFSIIIFLIALASYFLLNFYFLKKSSEALSDLNNVLMVSTTEQESELEKKALDYRDKIEKFSELIGIHLFSSKFFSLIEKNSHPQVWFSNFNLIPAEGRVDFIVETENFLTLEQQIKILENNPQINNLNLHNISIKEDGKVGFDLSFLFNKNILSNDSDN
ncbi:hypothetical protein BWK69_00325 [Candidatus Parcubacteria bacterium A4]|nr:MAG: hypothetical protein BWK69_00325 [Candidatus Parcubacteria bacterium A4]